MITKTPKGAVVVPVPRSEMPGVFNVVGYHQEYPYIGVGTYNLVIVPSGQVKTRMDKYDVLSYGFLWSGKTGKLYEWGDYYRDELCVVTDVGNEKVFVECPPDKKDYNLPVREVNVYATTAGVVWLALRASIPKLYAITFDEAAKDFVSLTSLEDAPFATYLDALDENEEFKKYTEEFQAKFRAKLQLFFGMCGEGK